MSDALIFDKLKDFKRRWTGLPSVGLTQSEVDEFNAALRGELASVAMEPSQRCYDLIMSFEGLHRVRLDGLVEAYPDPATGGQPWTIGYGTTGFDVKRGTVWTKEQCVSRFVQEVKEKYGAGVIRLLDGAKTSQHQFDALVSFAYNVGLDEDADTTAEGLGDSSLMKKHKAGDYVGAANEFAKWVNANGRPMKGLVRRRAAEADLYRGRV